MRRMSVCGLLISLIFLAIGCSGSDENNVSDGDIETDVEVDTEYVSDGDMDTEVEEITDGDGETEEITDGDSEGEVDQDEEMDIEIEDDTVSEQELELEIEEEVELEAETEAETEVELESESELEVEAEVELEVEAEMEVEEEEETVSYPEEYCRHAFCWSIPTNQSTCYNNSSGLENCPVEGEDFYGQAGNYYSTVRTYSCYDATGKLESCPETLSEGDMVKDEVTGLMWQGWLPEELVGCESGNAALCTAQEAIDYCEALDFGGYTDWHLPGIAELITLFDMSGTSPAVNTTYFPNTTSENYWSSTYYSAASQYFYAQFGQTYANREGASAENAVRCVRVETPVVLPATRYEEQGDTETVVVDNLTNLMWKGQAQGGYTSWQNALSSCENLEWNGYSDWRLPTLMELFAAVDFNKESDPFTGVAGLNYNYFTSTTVANSSSWVMTLVFDGSSLIYINRKTNNADIAYCVRTAE